MENNEPSFTGQWEEFKTHLKPHLMVFAKRYKEPTSVAARHINSDQLYSIFNRMCSRLEDTSETWVGDEYEKELKNIASELFYPSV